MNYYNSDIHKSLSPDYGKRFFIQRKVLQNNSFSNVETSNFNHATVPVYSPDNPIMEYEERIVFPYNMFLVTPVACNNETEKPKQSKYSQANYLRLKSLLLNEDFGTGYFNDSDNFFYVMLGENRANAFALINDLYIKSIDTPQILKGILNILANMEYEDASSSGTIIAIAALSHKDIGVKEYAVKCFDSWHNIDSKEEVIKMLRNTEVNEVWLAEYVEKVAVQLEELVG